jgi:3-hydroxyisobutyrate dehydrogenase-like beta-hydroxyacid dehydrogenase
VPPKTQWLIVGHGSVGSFLADRLVAHGVSVAVLDPHPRVPVTRGETIGDPGELHRVDYCASCVRSESAESVAALIAPVIEGDAIYFDWNTVSPAAKIAIARHVAPRMIDVALVDSVDAAGDHPTVIISGSQAERARRVLGSQGFAVSIAGPAVGQAAALKQLRSIFTKTLEALVLAYSSLASGVEGEVLVRESLERNLGETFIRFTDLLVTTDRIHADRRSQELEAALAAFDADGPGAQFVTAAVDVLRQAAHAWSESSAPRSDAQSSVLASHLRESLWTA